jgi:putative ABC transport system permease protein
MFYELTQLAVRNLARARARLFMTAGGVLVGTAAVVLLLAMTIGLQNAAEAGVGSSATLTEIQVYTAYRPEVSADKLPQLTPQAVQALWRIPGVQVVIPTLNLYGARMTTPEKYENYPAIMGIDPALLPYAGLKMETGEAVISRDQILIGGRVGEGFFNPKSENFEAVKVDLQTVRWQVALNNYAGGVPRRLNLKASGYLARMDNMFDNALLMPLDEAIKYKEWAEGRKIDLKNFRYDQITVRTTGREVTNDVSEAIRKLGYQPAGAGEYLKELNNFFGTMRLLLGGVGAVALIVAAFGVANTMTMAILERTREIGLMKAIGARDRDILTIFLAEAGLVGLAGGVAGLGLALALQNVINGALASATAAGGAGGGGASFLPVDPNMLKGQLIVIPPELMLFGLALATVVGLGAGFYPSLRAARMVPVTALKTE